MAKRTTIKNEEKIQEMAEKSVIVEDQVVTDTFPSEVTEEKVVSENTETEETLKPTESVQEILEEASPKRMFHLTHNDGDALGCAIVSSYHKEYIADIVFSSIEASESNLIDYLNTHEAPDFILISDLSVREEVAVMLENYCSEMKEQHGKEVRLMLVDHHHTNTLSKNHSWAIVQTNDENGVPISAAKLLLKVIRGGIMPSMLPILDIYIEKISRYDTWEWKRNPSEEMDEENTNILIKQLGIETAARIVYDSLSPRGLFLPDYCSQLINIYKEKRERFLPRVLEHTVITQYQEYTIALWVESGEFFNEALEYIYNTNPDVDIVWAICPSRRSFSFRTNKDDINVGRFAKQFGGGGLQKASGANNIEPKVFLEWLGKYYEGMEYIREQAKKEKEIDVKKIEDDLISIMNYCKDAKLKNTGLNYIELLNEHMIPKVNETINLGNDEVTRRIFLLVRTLLTDAYEGFNSIRDDINGTHTNLNNLLNIFRMNDEKEPEPESEVIPQEDVVPELIMEEEVDVTENFVDDGPVKVDDTDEINNEESDVSEEEDEVDEIIIDGNSEE